MFRAYRVAALAASIVAAVPAVAVPLPDGTATFVANFNPTVNYMTTPYTATFVGATFLVSASGGFAPAQGRTGTLNGTLTFSDQQGMTVAQSIPNFLVVGDAAGGTFNFSVASAYTQRYTLESDRQSFSLYLLGTTLDTNLGYDATATSLTIDFNQTGTSGFSASGSLSIPPAPIPEAPTWASFIIGFGLVGAGIRRGKARIRVPAA